MAEEDEKIRAQVNFVDGTFAFIKDIIPDVPVTENGVTELYHEYILIPTWRTKKKWNLKEKKEQDFVEVGRYAGYYKKRYKKILCQVLDPSPKSVWLLHCDWNGKTIDIFKGKLTEMRDVNYGLTKENQGLRKQLIRLAFEFMKASKDPTLYMQKSAENWKKVLENMNIIVPPSGGEQESGAGS